MTPEQRNIYSKEPIFNPTLLAALEPYYGIQEEGLLARMQRRSLLARFSKQRIRGVDEKALIIGRFQPPHDGHFYLIEAASLIANSLTIGLGSANKVDNDKNPFPAKLREYMLKEGMKQRGLQCNVRFVYLDDYDEDLDDYDKDQRWCDMTLNKTGKPDVIVGNNPWVNNIFRDNGLRVLEIEEFKRKTNQGTEIRKKLQDQGVLPFAF